MSIQIPAPQYFAERINKEVHIDAYVYRIRKASGLYFVSLRNGKYVFRSVYIPELCKTPLGEMCEGAYISAEASVKEEKRAPYGFELTLKSFEVLSRPRSDSKIQMSVTGISLEDNIKNRRLSIKDISESALLRIRGSVSFAFSEFMQNRGFVLIDTPKIMKRVSERDYVKVGYFDRDAALVPSFAMHMITAAGGLDRVYEIGNAYSSKNRGSARHLNEFTLMEFELSYASAEDTMDILTDAIRYITEYLAENCAEEAEISGMGLRVVSEIPRISFAQAKEITANPYETRGLDPTDERKLCEYAKKEYGSEYIFVYGIPEDNRAFYEKPGSGFVLLCGGIETASGGEHISDYNEQYKRIEECGLNTEEYDFFLEAHSCALPPVAGASIGLERFVMAAAKLDNIRRASLFPRDMHHIVP